MRHPNAAISDLAFRTLERLGEKAVPHAIVAYQESNESFKIRLMGLIAEIANCDEYFPLLQDTFENGSPPCRFWAANCIGRKFDENSNWPPDALNTLSESVGLLLSLQGDPALWLASTDHAKGPRDAP